MKLSTRNRLSGTVASVVAGDAMAVVTVTLGTGETVTASITRGSADELGLAPGAAVTVLVKSTDVMLGVE